MKTKIIELAKAQLGNDYTTYCRDMGYNYRIEWCACFVSWLAAKLKITDIIPVDMSCNNQIAKFKNMGVWHTDTKNIQSGDIIYYDWDRLEGSYPADHVGIVTENVSGTLTVIEGNNGDYPNDRVRTRKVNSNSPLIYGYARPNYAAKTSANGSEVTVTVPMLRKGSKGRSVKVLQTLLSAEGYAIGKYGVDGDFGADTESAVKRFQKNVSISVDGIVGKNTWSRLLK